MPQSNTIQVEGDGCITIQDVQGSILQFNANNPGILEALKQLQQSNLPFRN